jgi:hypothetical protein
MSNPFNPFQTRSVLRFPPEAQKRLCKLLIIKHLQSLSFLYSPNLVTFWSPFYSIKKEPPLQRRSSGDSNKTLENLIPGQDRQGNKASHFQ